MKYNWSIIGHEKQLEQIENDIESGNLTHAYLLAGPNSVGKFTVAKKMAGILQCENNFCHKCKTCVQIQQGSHVDTTELKGKDSIKIEDVRKIIERANMTGTSSYKIFLIQSIERMTMEAANSFLKILEEPPLGTIFLLTTNNFRELLPTIVSRTRVIKFRTVSAEYLTKKLNDLYPDSEDDVIKQVSLFSLGKTGKALHLMENPDSLANYLKTYYDIQNFLDHKNIVDRFSYVENLTIDPAKIEVFLNILTHILRSKILEGDNNREKYLNTLSKIEEAGILLKKNINTRLVLENLMLSL
ncbi:AAA family ATPase [Candidatus Peregrinibacteria bacterium]|nr:AAA family ATPase [Candidatus Peregrinibacteria bacterium]